MLSVLEKRIRKESQISGSFQQIAHQVTQRGKLLGGGIELPVEKYDARASI
jgi:hypothetical protein